jgi:formamidopyrimidine-DNA glycosylase
VPELPEVEVVRGGLQAWVAGRRITEVDVLHPRAVRRQETDLRASLVGARIRCVSRRGKYLWMPLDDAMPPADGMPPAGGPLRAEPGALVAHLGMSGQLLIQPRSAAHEPHLRVRIGFERSSREVRFVDQRTFGGLMTAPMVPDGDGGLIPAPIAHIARDAMDPSLDLDQAVSRIRAKGSEIKRVLLDQSVISGIGNIYADEALWRARIHGRRPASGLRRSEVVRLIDHVREVMGEALAEGGTSFDALYVNVNGRSGYFDRSLQAYGRQGEPCTRCGTPIRREPFMNRSSYLCPRCQRLPRTMAVGADRPRGRAGKVGKSSHGAHP